MPLSLSGLATVRTALVADVALAWGTEKIYTSAPEIETATEAEGLPVAAIAMVPAPFDSRLNSLCVAVLVYSVRIRGRFAKVEGTDLLAAKDAKAQALLSLLTAAAGTYHGANWFPDEVAYTPFPDGQSDAARGFYELEVEIVFHLVS